MGKTRGVGVRYDAKVKRLTLLLRVLVKRLRLTTASSLTAARERL
jgi:hypothetical protein